MSEKFYGTFFKNLSIDLVTDSILLYINKEGITLNKSSIFATNHNRTESPKNIEAVSYNKRKILNYTPSNIIVIHLMKMR
ncbi:rod shape-determining protein [Candidatus Erwinia haradaeae]|uniref:rod shape-determining protein n=1 Tax=Candidatus Erwinia haradaeae TaxID=1922217 RepID=UPI00130074AF|nr:rod shape-determining protein [Candidatus Erwinia haradaeae]